ncbi:MAG TPA: hypothetical protein VFV38_40475 [Ktedonobacteraceae bacterium]|nr:hypothetical protein [Ktedonobacteraceae bacterium]
MQTAIIHIVRKPALSDLLRSYKIFIDGKQVGSIRHGKHCSFDVAPGHHEVFLTIDWASSQRLSLTLAPGKQINLVCQAKNPLLAVYNVTAGSKDYIKLYQEE